MSAGDMTKDLDQWETRPCEPRVANEDAEDWCAVAQWESDRADRWKAEVAALRRQLEERESPDVVTVPRETLERARNLIASMGYQLAGMWTLAEIDDALRSGVAVATPPPDVVTVPREEWAVAQILANAWRRHPLTCSERDKLLTEWDALRSGEAGKGKA